LPGKGDTVLFSDTVIVFTSNIGAAQIEVDNPDVRTAFMAQFLFDQVGSPEKSQGRTIKVVQAGMKLIFDFELE